MAVLVDLALKNQHMLVGCHRMMHMDASRFSSSGHEGPHSMCMSKRAARPVSVGEKLLESMQ